MCPHAFKRGGEGSAIARLFRIGERHAVGIDVLSEQGYFRDTLVDECLHLGQDVAGTSIHFLATQGRNDAERTRVVAAHRDGNPTCISRFALGWQCRRKRLECVEDFDLGALIVTRTIEQRGQRADVVSAEDDIDERRLLDDGVTILLRQAPADRDLHVGFASLFGRAG